MLTERRESRAGATAFSLMLALLVVAALRRREREEEEEGRYLAGIEPREIGGGQPALVVTALRREGGDGR